MILFSLTDFAVLETNCENVLLLHHRSQLGEIYSSGFGFPPPTVKGDTQRGEGKRQRNRLQCPGKHLVTLSSSGHILTPYVM